MGKLYYLIFTVQITKALNHNPEFNKELLQAPPSLHCSTTL
jgi:hypothetical protein